MASSMRYSTLRYAILLTIIQNLESVTSRIEGDMKAAISWYENYEMVANLKKFLIMFIGMKDNVKLCIDVDDVLTQMTDGVKLLGCNNC